mmetsp:Transcript_27890/g.27753  ORF Transcript_27890/g.27753 Transcript_27890/m.27753 type:complete len:342 (-) Transcript_27890:6-1031(-)
MKNKKETEESKENLGIHEVSIYTSEQSRYTYSTQSHRGTTSQEDFSIVDEENKKRISECHAYKNEEEKKGDLTEKNSEHCKPSKNLLDSEVKRNDSITESNKEIKDKINPPGSRWMTDLSNTEKKRACWDLSPLRESFKKFPELETQLQNDKIYYVDLIVPDMRDILDKTTEFKFPPSIDHIKIDNIPCGFPPLKGLLRDCIKKEIPHLSLHWQDNVLADEYMEYIGEAVKAITESIKLSNFKLQDPSLLTKLFNKESKVRSIEVKNFSILQKPDTVKGGASLWYDIGDATIELPEDANETLDKVTIIPKSGQFELNICNVNEEEEVEGRCEKFQLSGSKE